jgi:hypothetical protein
MYNYLCNQCLSPLILRVLLPLRRDVLGTTLCDKVCQWLSTGRWFSRGPPVSSTNTTLLHDTTEMLLTVALNIRTLTLFIIDELNVIVRWKTSMNVMLGNRRGVVDVHLCLNLQNILLPTLVSANVFLSSIYTFKWLVMALNSQIVQFSWDDLSHFPLPNT